MLLNALSRLFTVILLQDSIVKDSWPKKLEGTLSPNIPVLSRLISYRLCDNFGGLHKEILRGWGNKNLTPITPLWG